MFKIEIWLPMKKEEQESISKILIEMDMEISSIESKLIKSQSIKQGMMQELLTGKTRLI
jgi:type I restriction enzyme S subunit